MDTNDLVKEILKGNKELYRLLVKEHYQQIYFYVKKQVLNHDDALDLTQEIFIKIYLNLKKFNPQKATFKTWIYKIAVNYCLDYFKSNAYKFKGLTQTLETDIMVTENKLTKIIHHEMIEHILALMNQILTKKQKQIILFYYFAELDVKEIAQILNTPTKTIYSSLNSSIKKIKMKMEVFYE